MAQVNLRIPDDEYELLEMYAKKKNVPITSLFRLIINQSLQEWKNESVLEIFAAGDIGFKKALKYSGLSPVAFLKLVEQSDIEPVFNQQAELRSSEIADTLTKKQLFKDPKYKRKTPPVIK